MKPTDSVPVPAATKENDMKMLGRMEQDLVVSAVEEAAPNISGVITKESIYCPDCGEIRPVNYEFQKGVTHQGNDHDATDIICDKFHQIATLHHPHTIAKFLGLADVAPAPHPVPRADMPGSFCAKCGNPVYGTDWGAWLHTLNGLSECPPSAPEEPPKSVIYTNLRVWNRECGHDEIWRYLEDEGVLEVLGHTCQQARKTSESSSRTDVSISQNVVPQGVANDLQAVVNPQDVAVEQAGSSLGAPEEPPRKENRGFNQDAARIYLGAPGEMDARTFSVGEVVWHNGYSRYMRIMSIVYDGGDTTHERHHSYIVPAWNTPGTIQVFADYLRHLTDEEIVAARREVPLREKIEYNRGFTALLQRDLKAAVERVKVLEGALLDCRNNRADQSKVGLIVAGMGIEEGERKL